MRFGLCASPRLREQNSEGQREISVRPRLEQLKDRNADLDALEAMIVSKL